jgi:hypothetical protein
MSDIYPLREFESVSLAIMPRPRAGDWLEDEVSSWQRAGVRTVVSLLEVQEIAELGLGDERKDEPQMWGRLLAEAAGHLADAIAKDADAPRDLVFAKIRGSIISNLDDLPDTLHGDFVGKAL